MKPGQLDRNMIVIYSPSRGLPEIKEDGLWKQTRGKLHNDTLYIGLWHADIILTNVQHRVKKRDTK
jgi:hypothetical protein